MFDESVEGGAEIQYVYKIRTPDALGNLVRSTTYTCQNSGCVGPSSPDGITIDLDAPELIAVDTVQNTPAEIAGFWLNFSFAEVVSTSQVAPDIQATQSREAHFEYEDNGLVRAVIREPNSKTAASPEKSLYQRAEYVRNAPLWNLEALRVTDADGSERRTDIDYDYRGLFPVRQRTIVDGVLHATEVEISDATGRPLTVMDPNGVVVQYGYDPFGRQREVVSSTGTVRTRYLPPGKDDCPSQPVDGPGVMCEVVASYDPGNPSLFIDEADNGFSLRLFDAFGRVRVEQSNGFQSYVQREFSYDERGRMRMASLPHIPGLANDQGEVVYEYDDLNRVVSETTPDGRVTLYDYKTRLTASVAEREFFFDGPRSYEMVVMDKPDGSSESREVVVRDPWGLPMTAMQGALDGGGNPGPMNRYQYGFFGQLERIDGEDDIVDPEYDLIGRVISVRSNANGTRGMEYSGFDQAVVERHDGVSPASFFHEYDSMGRLRARHRCTDSTCSGLEEQVASWTYDVRPSCEPGDTACENGEERLIGKLVQSTGRPDDNSLGLDARTLTSYRYESDPSLPGRLTEVRRHLPDVAEPLVTGFRYDAARIDGIDYPASDGQPFGISYEYDPHGTLRSVTERDGAMIWQLMSAEHGVRVKRERFGNDLETTYDYYSTANTIAGCGGGGKSCMPGLLRSITTGEGSNADTTTYEYNALNLMDTRVQEFDSTTVTDTYTYNHERLDTNQQIRDTSSGLTTTTRDYDYSPGGNLLSAVTTLNGAATTDTYDYGGGGRLTDFNGDPVVHDPNGNIVSRQTTDGAQMVYNYNDLDLPWRISRNGQITHLRYDADGARVAKRGPTEATLYAGNLYECEDSSGPALDDPVVCTEHRYKVYAGSRLVAQITRNPGDEERKYIHADHLGSVTLLSDDSGISGRRSFDPFGQPETDLASTSIHAGFTGHEHDQELGLINMKGRLYDPELRRFTTPDPFVTSPLHPQGLNRYAYVMNNPLKYTDPSGFQQRTCDGCGGPPTGGPPAGAQQSGGPVDPFGEFIVYGEGYTPEITAPPPSTPEYPPGDAQDSGRTSMGTQITEVLFDTPQSGGQGLEYGPSGDTQALGGPQSMNVSNPGGSATMSTGSGGAHGTGHGGPSGQGTAGGAGSAPAASSQGGSGGESGWWGLVVGGVGTGGGILAGRMMLPMAGAAALASGSAGAVASYVLGHAAIGGATAFGSSVAYQVGRNGFGSAVSLEAAAESALVGSVTGGVSSMLRSPVTTAVGTAGLAVVANAIYQEGMLAGLGSAALGDGGSQAGASAVIGALSGLASTHGGFVGAASSIVLSYAYGVASSGQ